VVFSIVNGSVIFLYHLNFSSHISYFLTIVHYLFLKNLNSPLGTRYSQLLPYALSLLPFILQSPFSILPPPFSDFPPFFFKIELTKATDCFAKLIFTDSPLHNIFLIIHNSKTRIWHADDTDCFAILIFTDFYRKFYILLIATNSRINSKFITRYSELTTRYSELATRYSLLGTRHSELVIYN
jgi:hypothetical protein